MYSIDLPAKEVSRNFIYSIERININQRKAIELQRNMYSNQEWSTATSKTSNFLVQKAKEKETVYFQRCRISMYIQSIWFIQPFSICYLL